MTLFEKKDKKPPIKIYVVFHKNIFHELYADLERYKRNVVFIGNIKKVSKISQLIYNSGVVYEPYLEKYDERLDNASYHETTAIYHVYINRLYSEGYVGFAQYDMRIGDALFETIYKHIEDDPSKDYIFYMDKIEITNAHGLFWIIDPPIAEFMLESYNRHFKTRHTLNELINNPVVANNLVICSTFIIPTAMFEKIMGWISSFAFEAKVLKDKLPEEYPVGHVMERAYGLALSLELLNKNTALVKVPIRHLQGYRPIKRHDMVKMYLKNIIPKAQRKILKNIYTNIKSQLLGN